MRGRIGLPDFQGLLVFIGVIPTPRGIGIGKLDDDGPLRLAGAFEQLGLAAADQKTTAKAGDAGGGQRAIGLVAGGIRYFNVGNDVSRHGIFLNWGAWSASLIYHRTVNHPLAAACSIPTCSASTRYLGLNVTAGYDFPWAADHFAIPDPASFPELYEGVLWRRVMAYMLDLLFIGVIAIAVWIAFAVLWLLSFGLLGPLLWFLFGLIPLAYHTLLLSGSRSATFGMRCFDLELRSVTGERPSFLQALIQTALFYITIGMTCSLILLVALFNRRRRTLHDFLAGTVMVRTLPAP